MDEDQGFDGDEALTDDDLVRLQAPDGSVVEWVLLAVLEHEGATYAVLTRREHLEDDEGELWVATYDEGDDGVATFGVIDDDAIVEALHPVVGRLIGLIDDDEAPAA